MEQEFEYGERVEVRDDDDQKWREATFVQKVVDVTYWTQEPGEPACGWEQIRKIQPKKNDQTASERGTIEHLQGQIHGLTRRLYKLESELNSLK